MENFDKIIKEIELEGYRLISKEIKSKTSKLEFLCPVGHEFKLSLADYQRGRRCPVCAGKRVLRTTSFGFHFPQISTQWHPTKNGNLTPYDISKASNKKVWWICGKGHEWETSINNRAGNATKKGTNCPFCSGNKLLSENSLIQTHPELAQEWHPTKNRLTPNEISYGSTKMVWWICKRGHEWEASCNNRSTGSNCPFCAGKRVNLENCLATIHPELVKEWQIEKNKDLTPNDVTVGSDRIIWWKCNNGHEWKARINKRTKGQGCPFCKIYHGTSFNEQAIYFYLKQIFQDAENKKKLQMDNSSLEIDVYLPCINVAIEYDGEQHSKPEQIVRDVDKNRQLKEKEIPLIRVRSVGLPIIEGYGAYFIHQKQNKKIENSIIWLINYIKELPLVNGNNEYQREISKIKVNIEKDAVKIYEMYIKYKQGDPLEKKFPILAEEWHPTMNGNFNINQFKEGSNVNVWWKCNKGHSWRATINRRTSGSGCPYCIGKYVTEENSLQKLNPTLAKEWHPTKNSTLNPSIVAVNSNKKVWWRCKEGHEWEATVNNRNRLKRGCPFCYGRYPTDKNNLLFINPKLSLEWHPTKNGELRPSDFKPNSDIKVWWICEGGHEWQAIIGSRNRGNGCPQCYNLKRRKNS